MKKYSLVTILAVGCLFITQAVSVYSQTDKVGSQNGEQTITGKKTAKTVSVPTVKATRFNDGNWLTWETAEESTNLGYNVYRLDAKGNKILVNDSLIAGSAVKFGLTTIMRVGGSSYAWRDRTGFKNASYLLESIDLDGSIQTFGPFKVTSANPREQHPIRSMKYDEVNANLKTSKQTEWATEARDEFSQSLSPEANLQRQREIANMSGIKLGIRTEGWTTVPRSQLVALGIDPLANPTGVQLYTDGIEQAINVNPDGGISFNGKGINTPTANTRIYYLINGTNGLRTPLFPFGNTESTPNLNSFTYTVEKRDRTTFIGTILNGAPENWYGASIMGDGGTQQLPPTNQILNVPTPSLTGSAILEVGLQGLTYNQHSVTVKLNGTFLRTITFDYQNNLATQIPIPGNMLLAGNNTVSLQSTNPTGDITFIDFIRLTYQRKYRATNNFIRFTVPANQTVEVDGFTAGKLRVLDITNPSVPKFDEFGSENGPNGYGLILTAEGGDRSYEISSKFLSNTVSEISANVPSTISDGLGQADMLIITPDSFRTAIEPLRVARTGQGILTKVISIDDIYDEYSYGIHSAQAITDFLTDAKTTWSRKPTYVLLVGDSNYDSKDYKGLGNFDIIPSALIDTSLTETQSDDTLYDVNNDGVGDLIFGRFPARTSAEVTTMVSKTLDYPQQAIPNSVVFYSDLPIGYDFAESSRRIRTKIATNTTVTYIDRDTRTAAEQRTDIVNAVNAGQRVTVYTGHGNLSVWTGGGVLRGTDVPLFTNSNKLTFFVLLTCLNGYTQNLTSDSIAEAFLKSNVGGGVAVFSSSAETTPDGQEQMGTEIFRILTANPNMTIGEASRESKRATGIMDIRRSWQLMGDPTLVLR